LGCNQPKEESETLARRSASETLGEFYLRSTRPASLGFACHYAGLCEDRSTVKQCTCDAVRVGCGARLDAGAGRPCIQSQPLRIHAVLGHAARVRACVQLMPMTATGESFSKYAAVLFFMGACISWCAALTLTLHHTGAPAPDALMLCTFAGAGRSSCRRACRCRPQHAHRGHSCLWGALTCALPAGRGRTTARSSPKSCRSSCGRQSTHLTAHSRARWARPRRRWSVRAPPRGPGALLPAPRRACGIRAVSCLGLSLHAMDVWAGFPEAALRLNPLRHITAWPAVRTGSAAQGTPRARACLQLSLSHAQA